MKSSDGKSQRREEERERIRRKKIQVREKVAKPLNTVFFSIIWGSGGSKSRLAKAAGAEPASWPDERWKIARRCGAKHISKSTCTKHLSFGALLRVALSKKCTPLWREAHFEVKMHKAHHVRTSFGKDVEKVHAVVARSTLGSQNVPNCTKHTSFGATFGSWDVEKVHAVVARSRFPSQECKKLRGTEHFWTFRRSFRVAGAKDCAPCQKWAKREGFVAVSKNDGRRGTF